MARASSDTPLVGRADHLRTLLAAVEDAAAGRPGAVLVTGDAGVGKTRLVTELCARVAASGGRVLLGHCVDLGDAALPYLPFAEALSGLAGDPERPLHPGLLRWLAGGVDEAADREVGQLQLFDAVLAALEPPEGVGPTLLVLEDLHWADRSSRDLLTFLVRRLRAQRLLVVGTVRSDDLHRRHPLRPLLAELGRLPVVDRLTVSPFTPPEMAEYVAAVTGDVPDPARVTDLLDRSEGNAYFAEQLLACSGDGCDDELPGALVDLLLSRVETLPDATRALVRAAAVAGRRVDHDLLAAVSGLPPAQVDEALREAVARNVLVATAHGYSFRHALAREAVYGDLLPGERARLHATFAGLLERQAERERGHAAELAHHRMASHDVTGALVASVQAAEEALALLAPAEALAHLERALQLWDAVPDAARLTGRSTVKITLTAAVAAGRAGLPARAVALAAEAVRRADEAGGVGDTVWTRRALATRLLAADRPTDALRVADEALALAAAAGGPGADGPAEADVAWAGAAAARALAFLGRVEEAHARAVAALDLARRGRHSDVEADLLVTMAAQLGAEGDVAASTRLLEQALVLAREAGSLGVELRVAFNLAVSAFESGDVQSALAGVDAAVARAEETGLSWSDYGLELRVLQVLVRYAAGDLAGSRRLAELAGRRPSEAVLARIGAVALLAAVARGDEDAGPTVARLDSAWTHDGQIAMVAGGAGAELQRWHGDPTAALATVDRAIEHVARVWQPWFMGGIWLSAVGLAAAGDLAEQARLVHDTGGERAAREAGERLLERARGTARHGRPRTGRMGPEGTAWLARAEAEWTRVTGTPDPDAWRRAGAASAAAVRGVDGYEEARCRWRLAEALLATGDRAGAAEQARLAHATARRLGAVPLQRAVEALVRRGRLDSLDPRLPRARAATTSVLTARELQVLGLLAEGLTNREAGARLFVSEKTVSVHVSNLMAKLGARSRTEAVTVAHRRGLLADAQGAAAAL